MGKEGRKIEEIGDHLTLAEECLDEAKNLLLSGYPLSLALGRIIKVSPVIRECERVWL